MRFVPVKSLEQQADLCLHRTRQGFFEERTATINRLRGLLAEFGHVLPQRAVEVHRQVPALLEQLPTRAARCIADLLEHVRELEVKIATLEREIELHARHSALARRVQARHGIGWGVTGIALDCYLRMQLVMGARSELQRAARERDPLSCWALAVRERRGYHRACVAVAAKNARVLWALLARAPV